MYEMDAFAKPRARAKDDGACVQARRSRVVAYDFEPYYYKLQGPESQTNTKIPLGLSWLCFQR